MDFPLDAFDKGAVFCIEIEREKTTQIWGDTNRRKAVVSRRQKLGKVYLRLLIKLARYPKVGLLIILFLDWPSKISVKLDENSLIFQDHLNRFIERKIIIPSQISKGNKVKELRISFPKIAIFLPHFLRILSRALDQAVAIKSAQELDCFVRYTQSYIACYSYLKRSQCIGVLVQDDLMPSSTGLICAASDLRLSVAVARVVDTPQRHIPPIPIDMLFCWNKKQSLESNRWKLTAHIPRPRNEIKIPDGGAGIRVGIVLASRCSQIQVLSTLRSLDFEFPVKKIIVRPHPGTLNAWKYHLPMDFNENFSIRTQEESLREFSRNIDIAVVGNSSSAKELLLFGIPIVSIAGLDYAKHDYHGWIAKKLLYFSRDNVINLSELKKFYLCDNWREVISEDIEAYPGALTIENAIDVLVKCDNQFGKPS